MQRSPVGLLVAAIFTVLVGQAAASGATGTYVSPDRIGQTQAFVVDVVQVGNQLTGRYEQFVQKNNGQAEDETFAFTAVVDGIHFAGQLKSSMPLSSPIPVSGSVDGNILRLAGDAKFHLELARGVQAAFQAQVETIKMHAAQSKRGEDVRDLTARMKALDEDSRRATAGFPALEQKLTDLTVKIQTELARERDVHGTGQRSVERGQISVGIHQLNEAAWQVQVTVRSAFEELSPRVKQLRSDAAVARSTCGGDPRDQIAWVHGVCNQFADEDVAFKTVAAETGAAFDHFKAVWQREGAAQEQLLKASDAAVN